MFDYKDWYHNKGGKEKLSKKRREKYANDPKFRQGVIDRARKYNEEHRKPGSRTSALAEDGRRLVSIGRLAPYVGRSIHTIRWYHRIGVIPEPLYTDSRGWRLYTMGQAQLLKSAFTALDNGKLSSLGEAGDLINSKWRKIDAEIEERSRENSNSPKRSVG